MNPAVHWVKLHMKLETNEMKKTYMTLTFLFLAMIGTAVVAETPNRTNMSFEEFVNASGCVIVDKGGYSNLAATDGGNCPFAVTQAFIGGYHKTVEVDGPGPDGVFGNSDDAPQEVEVSDN